MTNIVTKLLKLYSRYDQVYGPYKRRKDNRSTVILRDSKTGRTKTISWPKAMMEAKLGRELGKDEVVDHIDDDVTNNRYSNFQILSVGGNNRKANLKPRRTIPCPTCGCSLSVMIGSKRKRKPNLRFCSNTCRNKYYGANQFGNKVVGYNRLGKTR